MNIIVTDNKVEYEGFLKVSCLKDTLDTMGSIEFLVYHKSNETQEEKVEYLSKLKDIAETLIYIRDKEYVDSVVQMIVVGSGGKFFDDEFFLEDSNELNVLLSSLEEVTALVELGGTNVLTDFFNKYLTDGSTGFNKNYLAVVKEAVSTMIGEYKKKDLELLQLSETATEVFANSVNLISKVELERENLRDKVSSLKQLAENSISMPMGNVSSISFFPQVNYLKNKNIIRIKEIGNCQYLTSFILGFKCYLSKVKYVKPKVIFIYPIDKIYEEYYKDYDWITQDNSKSTNSYGSDIVFTNYPCRDVLSRLLDEGIYDTFIVIDRTKMYKNHILNSRGTSVSYCVSGSSYISKFGLSVGSCFSTQNLGNCLLKIPIFGDYPKEVIQREGLYLKECLDSYNKLFALRTL